MKQAFIYNDDKSQKFWIIDSVGNDIMVNFGKLGTNGRFQITEYADETECQKAADLHPILISSTDFILTMKNTVCTVKPHTHTLSDT